MVQLGTNLICKMLVGGDPSAPSRPFRYTNPAFALELCPACGHLPSEPSSSPSSSSSSQAGSERLQRTYGNTTRQRPNALRTLREILSREKGVFPRGLWRGLDISLVVTIPMVGIYMPLYDTLSARLGGQGGVLGPMAPAVAGMGARAVAVLATAPLELIRTQRQATLASPTSTSSSQPLSSSLSSLKSNISAIAALSRTTSLAHVSGMWLGVGATLWRDVPFTGIYWLVVEPMRSRLLDLECQISSLRPSSSSDPQGAPVKPTQQQVLWANLISGGVSGALAAVLTTPFDVVKTRMQVSGLSTPTRPNPSPQQSLPHSQPPPSSSSIISRSSSSPSQGAFSVFSQIWKEEGIRGLFTGVGPRAARTAPACAIVIATYETVKHALQAPSR